MSDAERIRLLRKQGEHQVALQLAVALAEHEPADAELQCEAACVHDYLGLEAAAVQYYVVATAGGLSGAALRGAYLGLGSTYRALGQYTHSIETFKEGSTARGHDGL